VILAGGGANLPYTLEFFIEKLGLPVEYFNPVRNVAMGKDVNTDQIRREGHQMGELVGLALRAVGKSDINIDLVPIVVEEARAAERRKPFFLAAAAVVLAGAGAWAGMHSAAAEDREKTVTEALETLSPVKFKIDRLLQREQTIQKVADAYVKIDSDHTFWMDLIGEVRQAFASDAVWITDFEPVYQFDIARALQPSVPGDRTPNGTPVVRGELSAVPFGSSSMLQVQPAAQGARPQLQQTRSTVNAVRIRGFWRQNPRSHHLVSGLIKGLREKSQFFRFEVPDPANRSQTLDLSDDQNLAKFLTIDSVPAKPGDLGMAFEVTLPLAREVFYQ
jgi:type IV pilus assembly protein PilM